MQIFVRGASELIPLELEKEDTVQDIREYIAEECDVDIEELVLSFNGTPLNDEQTVEQFGLVSGSTLDATVKLFGGKVHGSLARAGKVKGQTPKVAKQEKRKKKTGRAKRRLQYKQRFVNKVAAFGRRKGPNSNQPATK
ncbi:unnamed protein product [Adineta steineri]|uniref:Ubiquitin-like domain-containing protein n=1 Tax=Adineta steineri TaxID=433720 RepID=A0A816G9I8_9BILA|nr:unnamed protein product [Adineta steineri]CAF1496230.1 unnamed protein product [Adineta steineri]CAF1500233.1 unnamed protein product [Adineta steineri]CAF1511566.1 unnamed protein product [Adineta steineri]CAF1562869.1 unnamed protein product [Adineta steineri]